MPYSLSRIVVLSALSCMLLLNTLLAQPMGRVLNRHTRITIEKQLLTVEEEVHVQVDNKEAGTLGNIAIPYSPDDKFELLEAVILNSQGVVVRSLSKKEIVTRSYFSGDSYFADKMVKEFKLHWNEFPYQIRYRFQWTAAQFVSIANWSPRLYSNVHTRKASLQVTLPVDYGATITASPEFTYIRNNNDKTIMHTWRIEDLGPLRREYMAPPTEDITPRVKITPRQMVYGVTGNFSTWANFGNWQTELISGLDELTLSEQIKVTSLIKGISDPVEKIRLLYHYLQDNIRYVNVDIDIGGLKPYPASYVCDNKYGDCKALTIYMKALLKFAGIPSYYTLVRAGQTISPIDTEHPGQQFNHVILSVPVGQDTLWLENTVSHLPFNYLGTFTQNRHALFINGMNSHLIRTPAMKPADVQEHSTFHITVDPEGNGQATASYLLKGRMFEMFRYLKTEGSHEDLKEQVEKLSPFLNIRNFSWSISNKPRDVKELSVELSLEISRQIRKLGTTLAIKPPAVKLFDQELDRPENRQHPFRLDYPVYRTDSLIYQLPFLNQYVTELPAVASVSTAYGNFSESYSIDTAASRVIITRELLIQPGFYSLKEYAGLHAFIEQIKKHYLQANLVFHPKT